MYTAIYNNNTAITNACFFGSFITSSVAVQLFSDTIRSSDPIVFSSDQMLKLCDRMQSGSPLNPYFCAG